MNRNLKRKICLSALGLLLLNNSVNVPNHVYAASQSISTFNSQAMLASTQDDPNSFTQRIQRILDDYHAQIGAPAVNLADISQKDADRAKIDTNVVTNATANVVQNVQPTKKQETALAENTNKQTLEVPAAVSSTYDFDWQGTPIAQTLYAVAKIANKGVVVNGQMQGQVYTSLHNVTCTQALDYLSRAFNFNWMLDDGNNAIVISPSDIMKQSRIFNIMYADKTKIKDELKSLGIDEKNIYANMETGTVSVTGTPYQLEEAAKRISSVDKPVSQCLLVAQMIEVNHGNSLNLGMQYTLPTFSHTGTDDSTSRNLPGNVWEKLTFSATSSASKELSKGKVVARPMIMMLNGEEGTVSFGDKVPVLKSTTTSASTEVTVEYQDVGTVLKVTPIINQETSEISVKINAVVSNISKWVTSGQTTAPQISSRSAVTSAHLHSGQSFVIGGLMSVNELDNLSGIPGLMDLPILGKLFSYHSVSKTYAEVYIMITPYIVTDDINPKDLLRKVGE